MILFFAYVKFPRKERFTLLMLCFTTMFPSKPLFVTFPKFCQGLCLNPVTALTVFLCIRISRRSFLKKSTLISILPLSNPKSKPIFFFSSISQERNGAANKFSIIPFPWSLVPPPLAPTLNPKL